MTGSQVFEQIQTEIKVRRRIEASYVEPHRTKVLNAFNALLHRAHRTHKRGAINYEKLLLEARHNVGAPEPMPILRQVKKYPSDGSVFKRFVQKVRALFMM